ncbi:hypothetical protein [Pseudomonas fluorescens]|uniref:hypothetical protein n=1 Tax=Pseudomonas TaxID=286 RepID=UPI003D01EB64
MSTKDLYLVTLISAGFLLSACGAPTVRYSAIDDGNESSLVDTTKFYLQGSWISLTKAPIKAAAVSGGDNSSAHTLGLRTASIVAPSDLSSVSAVVLPAPVTDVLYAVQPENNLFRTTSLTVTYFDNSLLLKKVGIEYKNKTVQAIQAVGGVVTAASAVLAAPLASPPSNGKLSLPVILDVTEPVWCKLNDIPNQGGGAKWQYQVVPVGNECDSGKIKDGKAIIRSRGTVARGDYFGALSSKHTFVTSSCRDVILEIFSPDKKVTANYPLVIADPNWLYTYVMPEKGAITLHSICGADVSSESDSSNDFVAFQAMQEIFKQAKAIKDAKK